MTPKERAKLPDQPPAGNPRPHPRQGPRISRARTGRTRIAAGRDGIALVSAAAAARIAGQSRHAPRRRCRTISAIWSEAGSNNGTRCRRNRARNFWTTSATLHYFSHVDPTNARAGTRRRSAAERCRTGALAGVVRGRAPENHRAIQPVFRTDAGRKTKDAQHAVRRRARADGKDAAILRQIAARAARPMHSRLHEICRHESGGTRGISEKRRALVAIAAQGTAGLARPGGAGSAVAAAAAAHSSCRPCRHRCRPVRRAPSRWWPPIIYDL